MDGGTWLLNWPSLCIGADGAFKSAVLGVMLHPEEPLSTDEVIETPTSLPGLCPDFIGSTNRLRFILVWREQLIQFDFQDHQAWLINCSHQC